MQQLLKENIYGSELAQFIQDNLVGQRVTAIGHADMEYGSPGVPHNAEICMNLANGWTLSLELNEGCGGCSNGWSALEVARGATGVIMSAEYQQDKEDPDKFVIYIYLDKSPAIKLIGDDADSYYGYGFWITFTKLDGSLAVVG